MWKCGTAVWGRPRPRGPNCAVRLAVGPACADHRFRQTQARISFTEPYPGCDAGRGKSVPPRGPSVRRSTRCAAARSPQTPTPWPTPSPDRGRRPSVSPWKQRLANFGLLLLRALPGEHRIRGRRGPANNGTRRIRRRLGVEEMPSPACGWCIIAIHRAKAVIKRALESGQPTAADGTPGRAAVRRGSAMNTGSTTAVVY